MKHLILNNPKAIEAKNDVWSLQSDINRLFEAFANPFEHHNHLQSLTPNVDITESKDKYEVKAELPGMDEKDISLSFADGILTISGEKKEEKESNDEEKGYFLKECSYGTFHRAIKLPDNIAEDKIEASFKQGVLDITVPKTTEMDQHIRHIDIKS